MREKHDVTYIISGEDVASLNIGRALIGEAGLSVKEKAEGYVHYSGNGCNAVSIPGIHIHAEGLDRKIGSLFGLELRMLVFLSTHRSESGAPAATLHPLGNFGEPLLGGGGRLLVPSAAAHMTGRLMRMKHAFAGSRYAVTFEATHHGPLVGVPAMFAEIGSDESAWKDSKAALDIAKALLHGSDAEGDIAIGVGGGHYCPRFTDLALKRKLVFSHFVPNHQLGLIDEGMADEIVEKSGDARLAVAHRSKGYAGEVDRVCGLLEKRGLSVTDGSDVQER